jgi:hypothetical protein
MFIGFILLGMILMDFVIQSTSGFTLSNHGNPRITSSFPMSEIRYRVEIVFPSIFVGSRVSNLIGPLLFGLSSTFETLISFLSLTIGIWCFFANSSSIKFPWAPLSMSALISTLFSPLIIRVLTCIDFESLPGTLRILMDLMERRLEGLDVVTSLLTKNPVGFLRRRIRILLWLQAILLVSCPGIL